MLNNHFDAIILGAGGAGLMCAIEAGKRNRKVLVLDHSKKIGGKILISGGGRCNFTNLDVSAKNYVSENPHFCKSALSRFTTDDFLQMIHKYKIAYHERKHGQLFCDVSAQEIVRMLKAECENSNVEIKLETKINRIEKVDNIFKIFTLDEEYTCDSLVIATGGLSIPKLGATGFGYDIAKQFDLKLVERAPALDGFTFKADEISFFSALAGITIDVRITCNGISFQENLLFTHSGLSGPVALQASLHWKPGIEVSINLLPEMSTYSWFINKKREGSKTLVKNLLSELLPSRFAIQFTEKYFKTDKPLIQISDSEIEAFSNHIHNWVFIPAGTVGYNKAEVTRGGVDTNELSSKTMESKKVPGLYFIGEVVDVTGWLGGFNYQWAWASGWAAGQVI